MTTLPLITATQRKVLTAISAYIQLHGYPPSVRDVGEAAGIASTSSVIHQLRQLEMKGRIRRDPTRSRAIQILAEAGPA